MSRDLDEQDLNNLMLTWRAAITMAYGNIADFKESYIEGREEMSQEEIADWIGARIIHYMFVDQEELREILAEYLSVHMQKHEEREQQRLKGLH